MRKEGRKKGRKERKKERKKEFLGKGNKSVVWELLKQVRQVGRERKEGRKVAAD